MVRLQVLQAQAVTAAQAAVMLLPAQRLPCRLAHFRRTNSRRRTAASLR